MKILNILITILLFINFINLNHADTLGPLNVTQSDNKFTIIGEKVYIENLFNFSINGVLQDNSFFTSLSEGQIQFNLPPTYCGKINFTVQTNKTSRSTQFSVVPVYIQTEFPFTNNGSSLVIEYYYSTCVVKIKSVTNAKVNNDIAKCSANETINSIKCQISAGSGFKNFSATINTDGKYDIKDLNIRYGKLKILDQVVTFEGPDKKSYGTMTYFGYNFGNSSSNCTVSFKESANTTLPCYSNSSSIVIKIESENVNKYTFNSLRGLVDISIDGISTKHYFIICKIIGFDRNASNLVTDGKGYMIFKGELFSEAESDKTKGSVQLTSIINARFVNPLYRYICNVIISGPSYNLLNVTIPSGIGSGTMYLYYDTFNVMETPMNYTITYTPSNDSDKMTKNIVYSVIIVLGFFAILLFVVHNINPIRERFNLI